METFTRETYGIMVYQEQIMQIASEMAGFTMGEADTLRRAMGKKDRDLMATQKAKFVAGCAERGIAAAKAERVWELMEKFAGYGFNKWHAAAYALVAYQTAYFKANYPVEFMAALLTSEMGDTDKIVKYIDECRAMEIPVQPPDVNTSAVRFSVAGAAIRFGLAAIKNVGEAAMESILRTRRAEGPFRSLEDFCVPRRPAPRQPAGDRESHQGGGLRFACGLRARTSGPGRRRAGARPAAAARAGRGAGLVLRPPAARGAPRPRWPPRRSCRSGTTTSGSPSRRTCWASTSPAIRWPASRRVEALDVTSSADARRPGPPGLPSASSATWSSSRRPRPRAATRWRS